MPCSKRAKVNWLDKVKFVAHYAMNTCSTPWQVYVEMGVQADLNLVLNLIGISPTEAVYTLLRPKAGRTTRHGGGRGKRNIKIGAEEGIPDSAEIIADTVKVITGAERPVYGALGTYLFEIAAPIIQSAYYITLIEAVGDFAYDWYSGILLAPESKCTIGRFGEQLHALGNGNIAFQDMGQIFEVFPPAGGYWNADGMNLLEGTWAVNVIIGVQNDGFPYSDKVIHVRLVTGIFDKKPCGASAVIEIPAHQDQATVRFTRKVTAPDTLNVQWSMHTDDGISFIDGITVRLEGFRID
jgi:hypothetical protein